MWLADISCDTIRQRRAAAPCALGADNMKQRAALTASPSPANGRWPGWGKQSWWPVSPQGKHRGKRGKRGFV